MQTELFLVRHGEPVLQNALLGSTDSPLSDAGWRQLETSCEHLPKLDFIVSSPLSRCANFAQQYAADKNLQLHINPDWRECHFGDWDGCKYQQLHDEFPREVENFFSRPDRHSPPKGEDLSGFCDRVESALMQLIKTNPGKKIGVFSHAGVIRTLVAWCLKMDYASGLQFRRFAIDYASVTHLSIYTSDKHYPQLVSLNHHPVLNVQTRADATLAVETD